MTIIVAWATRRRRDPSQIKDHWCVHENMGDAEAQYLKLANRGSTYSVSICAVIRSTDYTPMGVGEFSLSTNLSH